MANWILLVGVALLVKIADSLHVSQYTDFQCTSDKRLTNGCNFAFDDFRKKFTPACNMHDICYYCVSQYFSFLFLFCFHSFVRFPFLKKLGNISSMTPSKVLKVKTVELQRLNYLPMKIFDDVNQRKTEHHPYLLKTLLDMDS